MRHTTTSSLAALSLLFLSACTLSPDAGHTLLLSYGYSPNTDTSTLSVNELLTGMRGTLVKQDNPLAGFNPLAVTGTPVSSVYPFPQRVTLDVSVYNRDETLQMNAEQVNRIYNNNRFSVEPDGTLRILYTSFPLTIPPNATVNLKLTVYNQAGIQYFTGFQSISPDQSITSSLAFPLSVDIDPNIQQYDSITACPADTDNDHICDAFEDMFINAAGVPDIDLDGSANSQDNDSDDDSFTDSDEASLTQNFGASNDNYPWLIHSNNPPTLGAHNYTTTKGQPLYNQPIVIIDLDANEQHTISIIGGPGFGTASIQPDASLNYTPTPAFIGTDIVTVQVTDRNGASASGDINIAVLGNHPPVANTINAQADEDIALIGTLSASDADGIITSYNCSQPSHGTVDCTDAPSYLYTPNANYNGNDSFIYTVTDNGGEASNSAIVNITVNPINDLPNAVDDGKRDQAIVSLGTDGVATNGHSDWSASNESGRLTAFWSDATNLDAYATPHADLYLRDNLAKTTRQVTVGNEGGKPTAPDAGPSSVKAADRVAISDDGHYTVFSSFANNLDVNASMSDIYSDIFVYDAATNTVHQLTRDGGECGIEPDGSSFEPTISHDGNYIAYSTDMTTFDCAYLVDTNNKRDIFIQDFVGLPNVYRISALVDGTQGDGNSYSPSISGNGNYAAFVSESSNFDAIDTNTTPDIYLKDIGTGTLTLISKNGTTAANGASYAPDLSATFNDVFVVFESDASNLVKDSDTNGARDIYRWQQNTNNLTRISIGNGNVQANGPSSGPQVSKDGRFVLYSSRATNLVEKDTNGVEDVFLHDAVMNTTQRLSVDRNGVEGNGASTHPRWADSGQYIVYTTAATNLDTSRNDSNGRSDIVRMQLTDLATVEMNGLLLPIAANDSDADTGDALTYTVPPATASNSTLEDNGDGTYTYWPYGDPSFYGLDAFQYTLADDQNGSDTAMVYLSVGMNHPPIAVADDYTIASTTDLDVVSNDFDGNGDVLTVTAVTPPASGAQATIVGNKVHYVPKTQGITDSMTYTVQDSHGLSTTGSLTVTIPIP